MSTSNNIMNDYDKKINKYHSFSVALKSLISELLHEFSLVSIDVRVKERESLRKKVESKDKYHSIAEITDIVGVRIITYLPNKVDEIADVLKSEFVIDELQSVDKRKKSEAEFGYMSLHLIMSLNEIRSNLTEYKQFKGMKFEIQIRTILQHAWAEIEHDLGYKSEVEVPSKVKRRFFRLASILELADEEFQNIVGEIDEYKVEVRENIVSLLDSIEVNSNSVEEYLYSSELAKEITQRIAKGSGTDYSDDVFLGAKAIDKLDYLGYKTIEEIANDLGDVDKIVEFALKFLEIYGEVYPDEEGSDGSFSNAASVFYLCYIKICQRDKASRMKFLSKFFEDGEELENILERTCKETNNHFA